MYTHTQLLIILFIHMGHCVSTECIFNNIKNTVRDSVVRCKNSKMLFKIISIILYLSFNVSLVTVVVCGQTITNREKRFLLFPRSNPTRFQFIAGIGIPVDVEDKSITVGTVFKAQYYLPYNNTTAFNLDTININRFNRNKRNSEKYNVEVIEMEKSIFNENDENDENEMEQHWNNLNLQKSVLDVKESRWKLYYGWEMLIKTYGYSGRACVLRGICEAAEIPFKHHLDIFSELLHIVLSPSKTNEQLSKYSDQEYLYAEKQGNNGAPCKQIFNECETSPLDLISKILNI